MKETKTMAKRYLYIPVFTATLFLTVKIWKRPMGLLMDEQIEKCGMYIQWNTIQSEKERKSLLVTTWIGSYAK